MSETLLSEVMAELDALEDPKVRAVNEKHGDDHGVNLSKLRALAKRLKTQHELAPSCGRRMTPPARLLALLICRPKAVRPTSWTRCCARRARRRCTTGW